MQHDSFKSGIREDTNFSVPPLIQPLLDTIRSVIALPPEEEEKFRNMLRPQTLKAGDIFIREGTIPKKLAFVNNGLFRYYYVNQRGSEFTKGFFPEHTFITSYTTMVKSKPSAYTIEALEASEIVAFDYADWQILLRGHRCWSDLLITLLEKAYSRKETRERELLLLDAGERYRSFVEEFPHIESRIKQHQVASYLGITPVALSRIRKSIARKIK